MYTFQYTLCTGDSVSQSDTVTVCTVHSARRTLVPETQCPFRTLYSAGAGPDRGAVWTGTVTPVLVSRFVSTDTPL